MLQTNRNGYAWAAKSLLLPLESAKGGKSAIRRRFCKTVKGDQVALLIHSTTALRQSRLMIGF
jgi:hypothetical protein